MMHPKAPFIKMADGRIVNFIESIKNRAIIEITPAEKANLTMNPRNDVVQMADGTLVSELETLLTLGGGGADGVTSVNGKTGAVTITAQDVDAYTKAESNALLGDKVDKTTYTNDKNSNDTKVNGSVNSVKYNDANRKLTVTKHDGTSEEFTISGGGGGAAPTEYLKNATYEQATRILKLVKQDDSEVVVQMNDLATKQELTVVDNGINGKIDAKINGFVNDAEFVDATKTLTLKRPSGTNVSIDLSALGGGAGAVTSVNGEVGAVTITPAKLDVYTKAETNALLDTKLNKADLATELGKKVDKTDYDAYKADNNAKVDKSVKTVAFDGATKKLTITKNDNTEDKVDLSSLGQGGGFETETLFEGVASNVDEYNLADDNGNYSLLLVQVGEFEVENVLPPMTSNTEPAPLVASANGLYPTGGYDIWKAFNQQTTSIFDAWLDDKVPTWIQIDTGRNTIADSCFLKPRTDGAGPTNTTIQGSYNGTDWEDIMVHNQAFPVNGVELDFGKECDYRYYRLYITTYNTYSAVSQFNLTKKIKSTSSTLATPNQRHTIEERGKRVLIEFNGSVMRIVRNDGVKILKVTGIK